MTNHTPVFTSSSATGSFTEIANTTDSTTLHTLSGTMNFTDADHSDTHTTTATLHSAVLSSGSVIPAASLAHFQAAMTSQITSDSNGSGKIKWTFSDADDDFDFLSKNQTLTLTYDIKVSDNHGGTAIQTVKVTVTGTDDKPVINMTTVATVTEQPNHTLSLTPDTVHIALNFTDDDLTNTGHTATVLSASATGNTSGIILGNAELMSFFDVDNVVKNSGSSAGVINTTFSALDLAFDYLAAGEHLNITYVVQLDDHAGGVSTQNVQVTVVGTNDAPFYICGPESGASGRRPERQFVRQPPRHWRPAVHRRRSVRYPHGLDHRHGDTFGRRCDPAHECPTAGGVQHRADPGLHRASDRRCRLEFCAAEQRVEFPERRRNADAGLSRRGQGSFGRDRYAGRHDHDPRHQPSGRHHQRSGIGLGIGTRGHHRLGGDRHHDHGAGRHA